MKLATFVTKWNTEIELDVPFEDVIPHYAESVALSFRKQFTVQQEYTEPGALRMSSLGKPGIRLAYDKLHPQPRATSIPFTRSWIFHSGDIFEALMTTLLASYGFDVTGLQTEVEYNGIKGHIDGIVDGVLVECKAMSDWSWKTFCEDGVTDENSSGYATQLNMYQHCTQTKEACWLILNKQTGQLAYIVNEYDDSYRERVDYLLEVLPKIENENQILKYFDPPQPIYNKKTKRYAPPWSVRDLPKEFLQRCYPTLEI